MNKPPPLPGTTLRKPLRWLLTLYIILIVLSAVSDFEQKPYLPALLQRYKNEQEHQKPTMQVNIVGIEALAGLVLTVFACVALWRLRPYGRRLFVASVGWFLIVTALASPDAEVGLVSAINMAWYVTAGTILGMLFFSEMRLLYGPR